MSLQTAAAASVAKIQELCDYIVDFLELPQDLRSTALVSPVFCHSAQPRLFYRITLDAGLSSVPGSTGRLLNILANSPHLVPLIRRLRAPLEANVLIALSGLGLCRVQEIDFYDVDEDHIPLPFAGRLISTLASLQRVVISGAGRTFADLHTLFLDCACSVEALSFTFVTLPGSGGDQALESHNGERALIKELKLLYAANLDRWFIHRSCPFDFSKLVDVNVYGLSYNSGLFPILNSARRTIQRLRLPADVIARKLDIAEFPALTQLELIMSKLTAHVVEPILARLTSGNTIHLIRLDITHAFAAPEVFREIDKTLRNLVVKECMPALRRVDISLDTFGVDVDHWRAQFPKLAACDLLTVSELRGQPDRRFV
ncbi:hypothetical protein C8R43DRAFT_1239675 [Mycena crocata]|nr:hypothetical protein C8R43DRAFT_1239675 [Mycena crocata]